MNYRAPATTKPLTTSAPTVGRSSPRNSVDGGSAGRIEKCDEVPSVASEAFRSSGQPLDAETRAFMEPRFGHDFGNVRVHTDAKAAEAARAVSARAYTVGDNIVFGEENYAPATHAGRELLAHELAHTVQQRSAGSAASSPASAEVLENSAEAAGRDVGDRRPPSTALPASEVMLARSAAPITAYTDEMLEKALGEVRRRLEEKSYSGRDRDVDLHMALKWEADKRALAAARADAQATAARMEETQKQTAAEEKAEEAERNAPTTYLPKSLMSVPDGVGAPPQFDYEKFERQFTAQKEEERNAEAARQQRQNETRPGRLAAARQRLILHGLRRGDEAEEMGRFLTTTDMLVLRKHGLEPPGILSNFGRRYAENAIEVIDKLVPRNPIEDRANQQELQRGASAIKQTAKTIESMAKESAHAFLGRLEGTVVGLIAGKDPVRSGEIGAAIGDAGGAKREVGARAAMDRQAREPSKEPVFAESAYVAKAPPREPVPTPRNAPAPPQRTSSVSSTNSGAVASPGSAPTPVSASAPPATTPAPPQTAAAEPTGSPPSALGNWLRSKILSAMISGAHESQVLPNHSPGSNVGGRPTPTLPMSSARGPAMATPTPSATTPAAVQQAQAPAQTSQVPADPRGDVTNRSASDAPTSPQATPAPVAAVAAPLASPSGGPMRRARAGENRTGMTATSGTLTPHKQQNPVVQTLPRASVPMADYEIAEPGHYIRRKAPSAETQRQILARAGRTQDGRLRDANTGRALNDGEAVWGHAPNYQFAEMRDMAERLRWTQAQFDEFFEDPSKWQVEYGPSNSSRVFDRIPRQRPVH